MDKNLIGSASYAAKTMFFFIFVGGLVGTAFMLPFVETITHQQFSIPESLSLLLVGYVVLGMPVAGFAGLPYGILLAVSRLGLGGRCLAAAVCGMLPSALYAVFGYESNPWSPEEKAWDTLLWASYTMLFTGMSSAATAWIHLSTERKFCFFRKSGGRPGKRV